MNRSCIMGGSKFNTDERVIFTAIAGPCSSVIWLFAKKDKIYTTKLNATAFYKILVHDRHGTE